MALQERFGWTQSIVSMKPISAGEFPVPSKNSLFRQKNSLFPAKNSLLF
jgi:hypothetical protein